jgi:thioredoxin-dependent peroxiredoxin
MNIKHVFMMLGLTIMSNTYTDQTLIGKSAPSFTAQAVHPDGSVHSFDLKDYIGKTNIVLYFYPMDNTRGCSKQAQGFCANLGVFEEEGIMVIGVSCDSIASHLKFQKKYGIHYPLVSDSRWNRTISKRYDAAGWFYSKRKTFLINKSGIIFKIFDHVSIESQVEDILKSFDKEKNK